MDTQTITQAITSVGFPIVCCIIMMYYIKYRDETTREEVHHLTEQHRQEMSEITEAIHNNTIVIQKLIDLLNAEEKLHDS